MELSSQGQRALVASRPEGCQTVVACQIRHSVAPFFQKTSQRQPSPLTRNLALSDWAWDLLTMNQEGEGCGIGNSYSGGKSGRKVGLIGQPREVLVPLMLGL